MAKVYPQVPTCSPHITSERGIFTIWMKSLVCHTNGCTVYNTNGDIVYRVENYDKKGSNEVHLMDLRGKVLSTIRQKNLLAFRGWNGYICSSINIKEEKLWFQVKKYYRMLMGDLACKVTVGYDKYWIVRMTGKVAFRVVNINGDIIAEAKPKQSSSGVRLGDDVLTLLVEPHTDHSLIMALVIVYGLICRKM
ncbi:hypothetical protein ACB092_10G078700 [Castanea dentata]